MNLCINPRCPNPQNFDTQLFCNSCGSELLLAGRYRVRHQLGSGGFGNTYEVGDRKGAPKVLKVLIKNYPKYVELFQREFQVLSYLKHPGIPQVEPDAYFTLLPSNDQEPLHCLVMEKIEGLNLQQYLQTRGSPIPEKLAFQWLNQIVDILAEVHHQHFFHRDIKPSNIMLRADGQLVLIDFGTARAVTDTFVDKQAMGQVTGVVSSGYTPPEQINGQAVPQSDFFALGRTFVYLLTGKEPRHFYDSYVDELRWREAVPTISPQLANFLDELMTRLPSQRPQTAEAIQHQLAAIYQALYSTALRVPKAAPTNLHSAETAAYPSGTTTPLGSATGVSSPPPPKQEPQLEASFISRCQQELAEYIGPIAVLICKRTLKNNPQFSAVELVEALAQKIPDRQQALEFQNRLLS